MQKIKGGLFVAGVLFIAGLQLLLPGNSFAEQKLNQDPYYTIQLGSFISGEAAEKTYQKMLGRLTDNQLQHLRIEKIKQYYVVRIGRYDTKDEADRFFSEISSSAGDTPLVTTSRVGPEVLVKEYKLKAARKSDPVKTEHFKEVAVQLITNEKAAKKKVVSPPPDPAEKKQVVSPPAVKKAMESAPHPVYEKQNQVISLIASTQKKVVKKCVAKPVLVLADMSGSMLDKAKGTEIPPVAGSNVPESYKKVEIEKRLLLNLIPGLVSSQCELGIYQFRFFPGKQMLYEPLLRIDSYKNDEAQKIINNDFDTDYQAYNKRSPIADVLQQLDADIFWKMSGRVNILVISDGMVRSNGQHMSSKQQSGNNTSEVNSLFEEVQRLKEKYGSSLIINTVFIETGGVESPETFDYNLLVLKRLASLGEGEDFLATVLLQDELAIKELSAKLCCAGK